MKMFQYAPNGTKKKSDANDENLCSKTEISPFFNHPISFCF